MSSIKPAAIEFYTSSFNKKQELKDSSTPITRRKKTAKRQSARLLVFIRNHHVFDCDNGGRDYNRLVGFVAISLIIIDYDCDHHITSRFSERTKEIGILRAMGASKKRHPSHIFTAETAIQKDLSPGYSASPLRSLRHFNQCRCCEKANVENVAQLPWEAALILISISIVLTMLAGLVYASPRRKTQSNRSAANNHSNLKDWIKA